MSIFLYGNDDDNNNHDFMSERKRKIYRVLIVNRSLLDSMVYVLIQSLNVEFHHEILLHG